MAGLVLKNVNKIFPGGQMAVRDFSLEIKNREFIILSGPAGCGKSTLLRMIAGLEEISSGSLFIDGKDMTDADPKDRNIAMVFKNSVLYPEMTVAGNLSFALRMAKLPQAEIEERIEDIAGFLKIEHILDKQPEELSMEERYRVLLGRALMRRPGILLLDSTIADLEESLAIAEDAGIDPDQIILDPGIGFGKTYEQNLAVIHHLEELSRFDLPILLGTSRKSVSGLTLDLPAEERMEGTLVTTVLAVEKGCTFVRVHDVRENVRAIRMARAILEAE